MLEMLLKTIISSLDLNIDPKDIERAWDEAKTKIPEIAQALQTESARAARIELMLVSLCRASNLPDTHKVLKELYPNET